MNVQKFQGPSEPFHQLPSREPPIKTNTIWYWMRVNLFSSVTSVFLTFLAIFVFVGVIVSAMDWAVLNATWVAESSKECNRVGACWAFIGDKFNNFIYGFYPPKLYWRVNLTFILFTVFFIPIVLKRIPVKTRIVYACVLLVVYPIVGVFMLSGIPGITCNSSDPSAFCYVPTTKWGGLVITIILSYVGILASFPIGIILALGRMSRMPIIKNLCIVFIELWRGVPLITVLFMASVVIPIFLPQGVEFNKLVRALIGITLFESAYMAEVIRGGLQAIPKGQHEASDAVGLTYTQKTLFVTLPQALKIVIPSIVGTSISLAKDTTLVIIIGLFDVLAIVGAAAADPNWLGFDSEGYVLVAFLFWVFCFSMSRYSFYLERKYGIQKH